MLLAAGLGTRLRPLTDEIPKALIPVGGVPILERIALRLIAAGADRLIINLHHLGDRIREYVEQRDGWGVEVVFSSEPERPLETGGGLLNARHLLRADAPMFVHNTDILTDLPLREMYDAHLTSKADGTLAAMRRNTSRWLLFDDRGLLGRVDSRRDIRILTRTPEGEIQDLAFAGIHVISPSFLKRLDGKGAFSILDPYLELAGEGGRILPFRVEGYRWTDIGKPDELAAASELASRIDRDSA